MLTYEQQTDKLLKKREALEERIREDNAEIEKINAKLKVRSLSRTSCERSFLITTNHVIFRQNLPKYFVDF